MPRFSGSLFFTGSASATSYGTILLRTLRRGSHVFATLLFQTVFRGCSAIWHLKYLGVEALDVCSFAFLECGCSCKAFLFFCSFPFFFFNILNHTVIAECYVICPVLGTLVIVGGVLRKVDPESHLGLAGTVVALTLK